MVAFGGPLYRAGLLIAAHAAAGRLGPARLRPVRRATAKLAKLRDSVLRLTAGWDQAEIGEIVRETLDEVIEPIVYDEALDLIREHQAAGRKVFIVSASPEEIVAPLAQLPRASTRRSPPGPSSTTTGRYTGRTERYCYGPDKVVAIARGGRARRHRPGGVVRLLRLGHRRADARGGRPPGGGQPRPRAAAGRRARTAGRCAGSRTAVPLRERVPMPAPRHAALGGGAVLRRGGRRAWRRAGCGTDDGPRPRRRRRSGAADEAGGRVRCQALRTFFVATVASAAITMSSSSFFMAAMVAGDRPWVSTRDVTASPLSAPRRVAARPPVARQPSGAGAGRPLDVGPHARVTRPLLPAHRQEEARAIGRRTAPDAAVRRGAPASSSGSVVARDRAGHGRRACSTPLADQPLWMQALAPTVGLVVAAACLRWLAGGPSQSTSDEYVRGLPRPGRRADAAPAGVRPDPRQHRARSATAGRSASRARRSTLGR